MSSKIVSRIFKILFQTEDIDSFVFLGVFFSRYFLVDFLKSFFYAEKNISGRI